LMTPTWQQIQIQKIKKLSNVTSVYGDSKIMPHNMDSDVTASVLQERLQCPKCGKLTLYAEFPDQYEAWVKCSSCGFFMEMSNEGWHRMENSPNINEKIKKMAEKKKG
jgi:hypothetical protein